MFGFFALSITAAAMGNARAAIDDFVELAGGKKGLGSTRTLAERPVIQAAVATAEASLAAARALYYEAIDAAWRASHEGSPVPLAMRTRLRLAATHAVRTSADVVRNMYDLAGGSAIYDGAPLQLRFRDAFTATAHFQVNEASRELPGRILLGRPPRRRCCDRHRSRAAVLAGPARRGGNGCRAGGGRRRLRAAVDRRDGDLRRVRAGDRDRAPRARMALRVGPLPVGVRTPVGLALGASSVASLTGCQVDIALGASSPLIVAGWHDRDGRTARRGCAKPSSACGRY